MKVLLADDHALFLDGLRNLLSLHGIEVVGTAKDGFEAVEKTLQLRPDIVLMDIRMPDLDGVSATRLIKAECPECKESMLKRKTSISAFHLKGGGWYKDGYSVPNGNGDKTNGSSAPANDSSNTGETKSSPAPEKTAPAADSKATKSDSVPSSKAS